MNLLEEDQPESNDVILTEKENTEMEVAFTIMPGRRIKSLGKEAMKLLLCNDRECCIKISRSNKISTT
ncbi:uncharacterized protein OCT59_017828 [Rhizophagus irregularis]|uniref:Uncharacterized protein n=1 Tax=Rhizophagus irregularis (strain DAOM 197198w) TaxID=1432141 RepID=A0A015N0H3_RHIIW|nr:hypothetical protein RirG_068200 [Rhizophagus irregularis DAOM 197198w]UZO25563.1 hypothetical protein OCT59_017828 [Rhizophagus irregularis]GBC46789.1 hypothetical protein GLOIN_2v1761459 [Rhizophagus irregularis DAOM 181602=DAOM 197198]CAG8536663.1 4361_t:CDS:2 [Rhizophagus irregularis]